MLRPKENKKKKKMWMKRKNWVSVGYSQSVRHVFCGAQQCAVVSDKRPLKEY